MKNTLLILSGVAALSLGACSQEKTVDTTVTADNAMAGNPNTAVVVDNEEMYKARSMRVADKYIADMKVSDAAMQEKIRTAYYDRSKRYGELRTKYQADTAGMAAAMRETEVANDAEFKTVYTDPAQYKAYEDSRATYDERNYMDDASATASDVAPSADAAAMSSAGTEVSGVEQGKTKMADGSKMKISADGDVKIKDAEGNKMKVDGDDGTLKIKPKNDEKTKIK